MELLVIGIDGGTKEIIEHLPMPFTQSLFKNSSSQLLEEDLLSRGWAEILTGCHAAETKAYYLMPFADKSYDFNGSYSKNDMEKMSSKKLLWRSLNSHGVKVGITNIPTTGPVDEVNGFFIAGGGGGINASESLPEDMYYPEHCKGVLEKHSYKFDIRLPGNSKTISEFINEISDAEEGQKNAFIDLALLEKPEFGFHCFRITTEIQYLCRYEIERCMEAIRDARHIGQEFIPENSVQESICNHYKKLDDNIKSIFEALNPEQYIFVGDHSTSLFKHEGNIDVWLAQAGYLRLMKRYEKFAVKLWKFLLRKSLEALGIDSNKGHFKSGLVRRPITRFHKRKTKAFGTFYDTGNFAGIFINDTKRFGGPVSSSDECDRLIDDICLKFNSDSFAIENKLKATPYRRMFESSKNTELMPDIRINKPDTTYFSSRQWELIVENPRLRPFDENIDGKRYPYTGLKGSDPLFVLSNDLTGFIEDDDPNDLTLVYQIINRYFSRGKS